MYGTTKIEELIYEKSVRMETYPLRKLIEERDTSALHAKMVDTELKRRGILDKLRRRKPEWFV
jgi:hypothetical protein